MLGDTLMKVRHELQMERSSSKTLTIAEIHQQGNLLENDNINSTSLSGVVSQKEPTQKMDTLTPSSNTALKETASIGSRPTNDFQKAIKPLTTFVANPLQRYPKSKPKSKKHSQSLATSGQSLLQNPFSLLSSKSEENGSTDSLRLFGKDSVNSSCNDLKSQIDFSNFSGFTATNFASKSSDQNEVIEQMDNGCPALGQDQGQQLVIPTTSVG